MLSTSHSAYNPLMNPMAYVLSNPVFSQQQKNNTEHPSGQEQLARLQEQNQSLQRKLYNKTVEGEKMATKLNKIEGELHSYKKLIDQLRHSLGNGEISPPLQFALQQAMSSLASTRPKKLFSGTSKKVNIKTSTSTSNCGGCCNVEKPYLCEYESCGKRFRTRQHLEAHGNVHTGRRFSCNWPGCGKSFCRKFSLVEHAKMHTEDNPNMCTFPGCNTTFSSKYGLLRHQNAQHAHGLHL